ncbi:MAG TPA: MarR family winged helix-turn-helix transcriptional regulator [Solirubrobacterales bacterium]|nr:MarR family winged helix-turn-helix transcriptional regulator [Solirubrobacterales bacterium]
MVRRSNETEVRAIRALARVARLLERSSGDLNLAHYRVLSAIAEGSERASRVADRLALGKPTVSAAVESLTRRGLLRREGAADDRRAATLSLTPAGKAVLAAVDREMLGYLDELLGRTPDPARVLESLGQLGQALDDLAAERSARRPVKGPAGRAKGSGPRKADRAAKASGPRKADRAARASRPGKADRTAKASGPAKGSGRGVD